LEASAAYNKKMRSASRIRPYNGNLPKLEGVQFPGAAIRLNRCNGRLMIFS
jgi:hypothetical protein